MVRTGPYTSENIDTFYNLAKSLMKKGHKVSVFLYEDGVYNVDKDIKSPQERNIADRMRELVSIGVDVKGCGTCAKFRGQKRDKLIDNVKHGGMANLVNIIKDADIFLSFGF